jgi:ankyrin repeat protein
MLPAAPEPPEPSEPGALRNSVASAAAGASNGAVRSAFAPRASLAAPAPAAWLQQAAEAGDISALQALVVTPIDINVRDAQGRTALMLATRRGHAGAVDILLAHGADPNAADADGVTPLQAALAGTHPAIAAALQRAGAH